MFKRLTLPDLYPFDPSAALGSQASPRTCEPNRPAKAGVAGPPPFCEREADYAIPARVWASWIPSNGSREIVRELRHDERAALERRAAELHAAVERFDPDFDEDRVVVAISAMFGGFRAMRHQGDDVVAIVDSTKRALALFPAWAIEKGCLKVQQGQAGLDRRYAPNDSEIFAVVDDLVKAYRRALASAEALLRAQVEPRPPEINQEQHDRAD